VDELRMGRGNWIVVEIVNYRSMEEGLLDPVYSRIV
jgi:hypothetical protein